MTDKSNIDISSYTYPNAIRFAFSTPDEVYDIYVSVVEQTSTTLTVEVYSPQTTLFNTRSTIPIDGNATNQSILDFLHRHILNVGFDNEII